MEALWPAAEQDAPRHAGLPKFFRRSAKDGQWWLVCDLRAEFCDGKMSCVRVHSVWRIRFAA
eukprot:5884940-Lingulodinium_polyedra.AAC.1